MKNLLSALILALFFAAGSFPQATPAPTATPAAESDVVKISTALIQVDVTVTDKSGRIINDLRRDEIEVYENGKKQDLSHFSFLSNVRETVERPRENSTQTAAPLPPTSAKPEQVRRTIALVVDDLTLSFESTYLVRRALKKFVDEQMQDGDLVAIIRTGAGIGALQQFTTDRRQLYAAIENVKWNPSGAGGIGSFTPLEGRVQIDFPTRPPDVGERTVEGQQREFNDFRTNVFATGTLGAINYVVRGMSELPGRKSILLMSEGFKLFNREAQGTVEGSWILESLRRLIDQANRASVVIYTMDARGAEYDGLTAADNTSGWKPEDIKQAETDRREQLSETQGGLRVLARETGGLAVLNSNDIAGGIRRVLDDQSYYLVAYEPDAESFDPKTRKFNRLDVRVTRPGARVRYRSGFFSATDDSRGKTPESANQKMLNALSSPFAVNDISLKLNALFGNSTSIGPFIRSLMNISTKDLTLTDEPDGSKKAVFDVLAVGYGTDGLAVDQATKTFTLKFDKNNLAAAMEKGIIYDFSFPVKKPGAYQLRIAIRDHGSGKVGSANQFVEVPNLKTKRLTLTGVVVENMSFDTWQKISQGGSVSDKDKPDPLNDTSHRRFKRGTVLNYAFTIFNAKIAASGQSASLTSQIRLFLNGKQIFEGSPQAIPQRSSKDPSTVSFAGSLSLASQMVPGEYVLQTVVTDNLAKEKQKTAYQFLQFEVIE